MEIAMIWVICDGNTCNLSINDVFDNMNYYYYLKCLMFMLQNILKFKKGRFFTLPIPSEVNVLLHCPLSMSQTCTCICVTIWYSYVCTRYAQYILNFSFWGKFSLTIINLGKVCPCPILKELNNDDIYDLSRPYSYFYAFNGQIEYVI